MVKRLGFLASDDPKDRVAQSGSLHYMVRALERHVEEIYLIDPISSFEKHGGRLADAASRRLFKRPIAYDHLTRVARRHGRIAAERVRGGRSLDALVAVMSPVDVACLETDVPIVLVLDATFALQRDYYPKFTRVWPWSVRQAESVERAAYQAARRLVYSTRWAAESAVRDYGIDPEKVHTIFFGANLDGIPRREAVLPKVPSRTCRLLFVGVGWDEKGGATAVDALVELEALGIQAHLTICGSTPPRGVGHERIAVIPFLDKRDHRQRARLEELYATSHFLVLPTRREAFGHVFCEASAYGLPSITRDTGPVPEVVREGENGHVLPYNATGADYARVIADVYRDRDRYEALAASSRAAYDSRMNWETWATRIKEVLDSELHEATASRVQVRCPPGAG